MLAGALLLVFLIVIAPIRAGLLLCVDGGPIRGRVGLMIWGIRLQAGFFLRQGRWVLTVFGKELSLPSRGGKRLSLLPLLLEKRKRFPRRGIVLRRAVIWADVALENAAAGALLTGWMRFLSGALPGWRVLPRFCPGGRSALRVCCIAESRLGILWAEYARLKRKKKEESAWSIPSGI